MPALKTIHLLYLYARDYLLFALLITVATYVIYFARGNGVLAFIGWFKLATSILGLVVHTRRKQRELAFYLNNGLTPQQLVLTTATLDLLSWIGGLLLLINLMA